MTFSPEQIAQINQINWFHHYDVETFGFATQGKKGIVNRDEAQLWGFGPEVFAGKSVLDVGAWDGYYSFLAEKMGASRVLSTDHFCWGGPGWGSKAGFDLVHTLLGSRVESREIDVPDISPATVGTFDVVMFLGVLYHLPNPLAGLQAMAEVTNELLIVETTYEKLDESKALFELRPERLRGDPTNYWSPNIRGIGEALAGVLNFKKVIVKPWAEDRIICFAYK
jgi:tRNA (mo5U34)-methyltransferase